MTDPICVAVAHPGTAFGCTGWGCEATKRITAATRIVKHPDVGGAPAAWGAPTNCGVDVDRGSRAAAGRTCDLRAPQSRAKRQVGPSPTRVLTAHPTLLSRFRAHQADARRSTRTWTTCRSPQQGLVMYEKLAPSPACGSPTPLARPPLSDADAACVFNWIVARGTSGAGSGGASGGAGGGGGAAAGGGAAP